MSLSKNEIKFVRQLQQKKYRDEAGLFVVEGPKLLQELLAQDRFEVEAIYALPSWMEQHPDQDVHELSQKDLERISGFSQPNEVLATVRYRETASLPEDGSFVLLLDGINDPGNLGTILRTADWFGINTVIASEDSVELYNPKVIQSTMGSVFRVHYSRQKLAEVSATLQAMDYRILLAEMDGEDPSSTDFSGKIALVMGSESHGIRGLEGESITIPSFGKSESLNVGVACGILLNQYRSRVGGQ